MDAGRPEILETGGERNLRYRGRLLYSERGPAFLAARVSRACETGPGRLYLVASPGLWHGLPELLSRIGPDSAVLCVEAEPELARLERAEMPPSLSADGRLSFLEARDEASILAAARALGEGQGSFRRCVPLRLSGGEAFHSELYRRAAALLQADFASYWRSKAALLSMGRLWARNIFRNLAALPELELGPPPRLGPTAVCGAGPSLERALPFIAEAKAEGLLSVLACDTALSPLLDSGILPDLVVCLEGQAYNLADFTALGGRRVGLLADLSSHPATFKAVAGPKSLSFVSIVPSRFLDRIGGLGLPLQHCPPLASVGVHSVHLARRLSSGPLFLTGLDFSYELGKTHSRGSPSLRAAELRLGRLERWPGQYASSFRALEGPLGADSRASGLLTDPALSSYAALLADELSRPGPTAYDLRGGGLPVGAPSLDFEAALSLLRGLKAKAGLAAPAEDAGGEEGGRIDAAVLGRRIGAFFGEELERLASLSEALKGRAPFEAPAFLASVSASDYLLWPMPDSGRLGELPQDLLNRLLVEVEYWRWKLGEIRASAGF